MNHRSDKILMIGDTHGEWGRLNDLLNKKRPSLAIILGDFGWWPSMKGKTHAMGQVKPFDPIGVKVPDGCTIRWLDGNHEEHEELRLNYRLDKEEVYCYTGVYHQPRGSVLILPDGRKVLFYGGASSIDRRYRVPGYDWFPEEIPSLHEFDRAMSHKDIDIILSHTCPDSIVGEVCQYSIEPDPTRIQLDRLVEKYHPSQMYFGHWHTQASGVLPEGTTWRCLNHISSHGICWHWL